MNARSTYYLTIILASFVLVFTACDLTNEGVRPDTPERITEKVDEQSDMRATLYTSDQKADKVVPRPFTLSAQLKADITLYDERPVLITDNPEIREEYGQPGNDYASRYTLEAAGDFKRTFMGPAFVDANVTVDPKLRSISGTVTIRSILYKGSGVAFEVHGGSDLESLDEGTGHSFRLALVKATGVYTVIEPWANGSITGLDGLFTGKEITHVDFTINGMYQAG